MNGGTLSLGSFSCPTCEPFAEVQRILETDVWVRFWRHETTCPVLAEVCS